MNKILSTIAMIAAMLGTTWAEDQAKEVQRVQAATNVLKEIMAAPDKGIPEEILSAAECVAVAPSMLKGGFVFGASYGKGVATCRNGNSWSAPAPFRIEGGSWGLQVGGQEVDLVMLVMNQKGMQDLLQSKFKLGADVSAAAGPVGRHAEATTDWKMRAEVLTYSRARGAFAGISLSGAVIKQDEDDTVALYGKNVPFASILTGQVPAPTTTQPFLADVAKYFRISKRSETAAGTGGVTGASANMNAQAQAQAGTTGKIGSGTKTSGSQGTTTESGTAVQSAAAASGDMPVDANDVKDRIETALRDTPGLSSSNVLVSVTAQGVQLSGSVPTETDKATVRRLAQQNAGGLKVDDTNLIVK